MCKYPSSIVPLPSEASADLGIDVKVANTSPNYIFTQIFLQKFGLIE